MNNHQIAELLKISLINIKDIADINMIVGDAIKLGEATVIPISKVKYSFISGGLDQKINKAYVNSDYPFGGGTGGSTTITPIAFLSYCNGEVKLLHLEETTHILEEILAFLPNSITKIMKQIQDNK